MLATQTVDKSDLRIDAWTEKYLNYPFQSLQHLWIIFWLRCQSQYLVLEIHLFYKASILRGLSNLSLDYLLNELQVKSLWCFNFPSKLKGLHSWRLLSSYDYSHSDWDIKDFENSLHCHCFKKGLIVDKTSEEDHEILISNVKKSLSLNDCAAL